LSIYYRELIMPQACDNDFAEQQGVIVSVWRIRFYRRRRCICEGFRSLFHAWVRWLFCKIHGLAYNSRLL